MAKRTKFDWQTPIRPFVSPFFGTVFTTTQVAEAAMKSPEFMEIPHIKDLLAEYGPKKIRIEIQRVVRDLAKAGEITGEGRTNITGSSCGKFTGPGISWRGGIPNVPNAEAQTIGIADLKFKDDAELGKVTAAYTNSLVDDVERLTDYKNNLEMLHLKLEDKYQELEKRLANEKARSNELELENAELNNQKIAANEVKDKRGKGLTIPRTFTEKLGDSCTIKFKGNQKDRFPEA